MTGGSNITGIPTDALVIGFGTLCAAIGSWMIGQLGRLRTDAEKRGRHIAILRTLMIQVCKRLDIPYDGGD